MISVQNKQNLKLHKAWKMAFRDTMVISHRVFALPCIYPPGPGRPTPESGGRSQTKHLKKHNDELQKVHFTVFLDMIGGIIWQSVNTTIETIDHPEDVAYPSRAVQSAVGSKRMELQAGLPGACTLVLFFLKERKKFGFFYRNFIGLKKVKCLKNEKKISAPNDLKKGQICFFGLEKAKPGNSDSQGVFIDLAVTPARTLYACTCT